MTQELSDYRVDDKHSFIKFIELLKSDFIKNPESWENRTLEDFLEAIGACAEDIQGYYSNFNIRTDANIPSWQTFADISKERQCTNKEIF